MNERDFDNIFRRKMEQLPASAPDQQIWQNIDNQLNTSNIPNHKYGNWSKIALAGLLLLSMFFNFFFWKKWDKQSANMAKKELFKNDTVYNKIVIYKFDTITTTVHLEQQIITKTYNQNKNSTTSLKDSNVDKKAFFVAKNSTISENKEIIEKENLVPTKNIFVSENEVQSESNIGTNKNQINENYNTQNADKEIIVAKNTVIQDSNKVENITSKSLENKVEETTENTTVKEKVAENLLPNKIKPVKKPAFSQWSAGISSLNGILAGGENGRGEYNGIGITVAAHLSSHWRVAANVNVEAVDFSGKRGKKDFYHGQPNANPSDTLIGWRSKNQPFSQILFGVERTFNYKKLETFVGVATGLNLVLPYEVQHETKRPSGLPQQTYTEEIKKGYATFAGVQLSAGASYPIYKCFNITLATQYQYNTAIEKLNWKNQFGFKTGLRYAF
jgi:hypothetical protein